MKKTIFFLLLVLHFVNCTSGQVMLDRDIKNAVVVSPSVKGSSCGFLGLVGTAYYFIPIFHNSRVEDAYRDALSKAPGAYSLRNVSIKERWTWIVIGTLRCYEISGEAVKW